MSKLFRIKPLEKKSIENIIDVYSKDKNDNIREWSVSEIYRWGQGFRDFEDPISKSEIRNGVICNPQIGWGCELEDLSSVYFNFDDSFTDKEKTEIESRWQGVEDEEGRSGSSWLYEGDHDWLIEDDYVRIFGPVQIDIVLDEVYNSVVEENIPLALRSYDEA
jgi:hypothetical protein